MLVLSTPTGTLLSRCRMLPHFWCSCLHLCPGLSHSPKTKVLPCDSGTWATARKGFRVTLCVSLYFCSSQDIVSSVRPSTLSPSSEDPLYRERRRLVGCLGTFRFQGRGLRRTTDGTYTVTTSLETVGDTLELRFWTRFCRRTSRVFRDHWSPHRLDSPVKT